MNLYLKIFIAFQIGWGGYYALCCSIAPDGAVLLTVVYLIGLLSVYWILLLNRKH